ncbi:glycine-rich domain-containing protein [Streptomyces mirabilis]|uniref:glycine-rich domain-containing protein n=1 Tax=Streptomyces mirabilis TaxID=68239 RepID=UPI0037F71899
MSESIFREIFMKFIPPSRPRRAVLVFAMAAASLLSPGTASAASAAEVRTFASVGKHTFTVPKGVSHIRIVALGGGGGGGGGGGNDGGSLSGGGGGGGGSSAVVSCLISVKSGSEIPLTVGSGGPGGKGGSDDHGGWGRNGTDTTVGIGGILASAEHGWEGPGGNASNWFMSGGSTRGGGGGGAAASRCEGTDRTITPGNGGAGGEAGSSNYRGGGGHGAEAPQSPESCPAAGMGGQGGIGAGNVGASNAGHQVPSNPGTEGHDGCVVLIYTADVSSS